MDHMEHLVEASDRAACVLGNLKTRDFLLFNLTDAIEDAFRDEVARRGLYVCGVLGMVNGLPRCAFSEPLDNDTVAFIAQAFLACVTQGEIDRLSERAHANLDESKPCDFAAFMAALHALPDNRD